MVHNTPAPKRPPPKAHARAFQARPPERYPSNDAFKRII